MMKEGANNAPLTSYERMGREYGETSKNKEIQSVLGYGTGF